MNYVIVRTRLQALIVLELLERGVVTRPFRLVCLHQHRTDEDSAQVYEVYDQIAREADAREDIVQAHGLLKGALRLRRMVAHAMRTGGKVFAASINYYGLGIAFRLTPGARLYSFDDGAANVAPEISTYFQDRSAGSGAKRLVGKLLLPKGPATFLRGRIARHWTIYPGLPNIVPADRMESIEMDWAAQMPAGEAARLPASVSAILLGAPYHDMRDAEARAAQAAELLPRIDLYLPHPRERGEVATAKAVRVAAPAEAVIDHYARAGQPLTIHHFGSSAVLPFASRPQITLINLRPYTPEHWP